MERSKVWLAVGIAALGVNTAHAQINGIKQNPRVFNDFTTSALVMTDTDSVNQGPVLSSASIRETLFVDDGMGGNFTNRHDFLLSHDGGSTGALFSIDDSWTFKSIVTLAAGDNVNPSPSFASKEAGLRLNSPGEGQTCTPMDPTPCTGDVIFLVKTNGEIAAFGGGAPFYTFSGGSDPDYIPGTPILLGMTMTANGDGIGPGDNLVEYFIDRLPGVPGGEETSGPLAWDNIEGGPVAYNIGMYGQGPPNLANPADFISADFNDIMFVPEPSSVLMSILGIFATGFVQRRRV
jgi:hypothetical protein